MFKKIICAFLVTTTMLSFVACSNNKNTDDTKAADEITEPATEQKIESVTEQKTEPATQPIKNSYVYLEDMVGESFATLFDEGYVYINYQKKEDTQEYLFDLKIDNADSDTMKLIKKLDGKTVKELYDKGISIGYFLNEDKKYTFFTLLGSVQVNFKIDGAADIIKKYDKANSTEIGKMKELQSLKLSEVVLDGITYTVKVNETVDKAVLADVDKAIYGDIIEATEPTEPTEPVMPTDPSDPTQPTEPQKTPEMILAGYTVAEFYYTPIPENYL